MRARRPRRRPVIQRRALGSAARGECGAPGLRAGAKLSRASAARRRGKGERPRGQGRERPGGRPWAGRAGSGCGAGGAWPGPPGAVRTRLGSLAEGEGPARGAHLGAPAAPASQKDGGPEPPRGSQALRARPPAAGPAAPGGRAKVLAGGTGREKDAPDLGRRGHPPRPGIWPR